MNLEESRRYLAMSAPPAYEGKRKIEAEIRCLFFSDLWRGRFVCEFWVGKEAGEP